MEPLTKIKVLQAMYAGALADAVLRMGREGVLDRVAEDKRKEQMNSGRMRARQLGIATPEEVFIKLPDLMGCADWMVTPGEEGRGFTATATQCMLCALAKKLGAPSPCRIYCLDPMEGITRGLAGNIDFDVRKTLYENEQCHVVVSMPNQD